ncbi:hypothetical protein BJX64DRAFT_284396 [Aspergillus heterothallicus]
MPRYACYKPIPHHRAFRPIISSSPTQRKKQRQQPEISFGFGISDFLIAFRLFKNVAAEIKNYCDAPAHFQPLRAELGLLQNTLLQAFRAELTLDVEKQFNERIRAIAVHCHGPLQIFLDKMRQKTGALGHFRKMRTLGEVGVRLAWSMVWQKDVKDLRKLIISEMVAITVLLSMQQILHGGLPRRKRKSPTVAEEPQPQEQQQSRKRKADLDPNDPDYFVKHWVMKGTMPRLGQLGPREQALLPYLARERPPRRSGTTSASGCRTDSIGTSQGIYAQKICAGILRRYGSYMASHKEGMAPGGTSLCQGLFARTFETPRDSEFEDTALEDTLQSLSLKSEAAIIRLIAGLIVPSAESAFRLNRISFGCLAVTMDETWDCCIPLDDASGATTLAGATATLTSGEQPRQKLGPAKSRLPRPQPDYAVGFSESSFTQEQLDRLALFIGHPEEISYFRGTENLYFPFMVSEVKSESTSLSLADRPIANAMGICLRGIVNLFRMVDREAELHQQVLGFSVAHNVRTVNIYAHYPIIAERQITFHHRLIRHIFLSDIIGDEKWVPYKFALAVYEDFAPALLKKLQLAIDEIPTDLDFEPLVSASTDDPSSPNIQIEQIEASRI